MTDLDAAAQFVAGHARVLDRRRFERLFSGSDARPVRDAVAAFRNADGGFGHALEPDGRTPASQPAAVAMALATLDEADAWDEELVAGACAWLEANAPDEGGASFVESTAEGWPHAPWWRVEEGRPGSLFSTGKIAGTLHARRVEHPWLDRATELLWRRIDELRDPGPYGPLLSDAVALDPAAEGEVHTPSTSRRTPTRSRAASSTRARSTRTSTTWLRVRPRTEAGRSTGSRGRRSPRSSGAGRSPSMRSAPCAPTVASSLCRQLIVS